MKDSVLTHCLIWSRPDETIVHFTPDGDCGVNLDGYAILPVEDYYKQTAPSFGKWFKSLFGKH